jgi:hypothetical protein
VPPVGGVKEKAGVDCAAPNKPPPGVVVPPNAGADVAPNSPPLEGAPKAVVDPAPAKLNPPVDKPGVEAPPPKSPPPAVAPKAVKGVDAAPPKENDGVDPAAGVDAAPKSEVPVEGAPKAGVG